MSEKNNKSADKPEEPTVRGGVQIVVSSEGGVQINFVGGPDGQLHIHDLVLMAEMLNKEAQHHWDVWKKQQARVIQPAGSILRPV